jgi:hypothetical protein
MKTNRQTLKGKFVKQVEKIGREWTEIQPAWLGDLAGTVETGTLGVLYARLSNGKVVQVHNTFGVPPTRDLHVKIGRSRVLSRIWQIIEVVEDYDTPAAGGEIAYHHAQHMFGHGDMLPVDRKQLMAFTVMVYDGASFIVTIFGGVAVTSTGVQILNSQNVDLSAHVPTAGAIYLNIEVNDSLVVSLHEGANFGAPAAGSAAYIAAPDPGKYIIAYLLLFEGQTELLDENIIVPTPIGIVPKAAGLQVHQAAADTPLAADEFGFWDVVDGVMKKIAYEDLMDIAPHKYRQFVTVGDGAGGWTFVSSGGAPVFDLQDLE